MGDIKKLLTKNKQLNQLDMAKVTSHVQREKDDWVLNTIVLEGHDVPFQYTRRQVYKNLTGARVNLTFYNSPSFYFSASRLSCINALMRCFRSLVSSGELSVSSSSNAR